MLVCVKTAVKTVETLVGFQAPALFQSSKEGLDRFTGILTHATYRLHAPLAYVVISKAGPTAQFLFRKPSLFLFQGHRPHRYTFTSNVCSFCFLVLTVSSTVGVPHLLHHHPLHTHTHPQRKQCYRTVKILSLQTAV